MEHRFEDLSIDVDDIPTGYFSGVAYLEHDGEGFWVAAIRSDAPVRNWLSRNRSPLQVELFRAIEAALYASPHARDAWAAHCENERADAA
jgi:hypothetical protein